MSGLEVAALVAGLVGAGASSISAGKSMSSSHKRTVTREGNRTVTTEKSVITSGDGHAGVTKNGDLYASSTKQGSAAAYSYYNSK